MKSEWEMRRVPLLPRTTIFVKLMGFAVISERTFPLWLFVLHFAGLPCPSDFLVAPLHNINCFEIKCLFHNLTISNIILKSPSQRSLEKRNSIFFWKIPEERICKKYKNTLVLMERKAFIRKKWGGKIILKSKGKAFVNVSALGSSVNGVWRMKYYYQKHPLEVFCKTNCS